MSGFGDLLGGVISEAMGSSNAQTPAGGGGNAAVIAAVMTLINQHGGIGGLVQQFQNAGLGGVAQSWVSSGQNQPVSGAQVTQALGGAGGALGQFAQQLGLDHGAAGALLAQVLPQVVDHLTPNGQVGEHSQLGDLAKQLLGNSKLFG
jgi:uncharacterized protein YidB (DUF937 family)